MYLFGVAHPTVEHPAEPLGICYGIAVTTNRELRRVLETVKCVQIPQVDGAEERYVQRSPQKEAKH